MAKKKGKKAETEDRGKESDRKAVGGVRPTDDERLKGFKGFNIAAGIIHLCGWGR